MKWSEERSITWRRSQPWRCGLNYVTSTAVNSTEMWQAASFDAETIARELGWAGRLGFNGCRVFLQYLVWDAEPVALLDRFERFLDLAAAHGLGVMPVLFDDCAFSGKQPYLGPQAPPVAGVHNSGWTPSPGHRRVTDEAGWPRLEGYVTAFVERFRNDPRVTVWDIYNEPGNSDMGNRSLALLRAAFGWARAAAPVQPLTAGVWNPALTDLNAASLELSDVASFHCYLDLAGFASGVQDLRAKVGARPILCTEWMARKFNSRFGTHLPYLRSEGIDGYSWGLVKGKTQTHFPWGSPEGAAEPEEWFHEVLHPDGTPYREEEAAALRRHTGRTGGA